MRRILRAALPWQALCITVIATTTVLVFAQNRVQPIFPPQAAKAVILPVGFDGSSGRNLVPDPAIAVGLDRIVTISNAEVAIYNKAGETIARKGLHPFFLPAMVSGESSAGDVAVIFDERSERFFLSQAAKIAPQVCQPGTCIGHNMLAVSKTSAPSSLDEADWYVYAIDRYTDRTAAGSLATTTWGDFDKLGVDDQTLAITSLQYRESDGAPMGPKIRLLDKAPLIAGQAPATWTDVLPDADQFRSGIVPARMFGNTPTFFLVSGNPRGTPCGFTVWGISGPRTDPVVTRRSVVLEGNCNQGQFLGVAGQGPQLNGPPIDIAGVGVSTIPVFRNGHLWMAHTWQMDFGAGAVAAIKWAEFDVSHWPDAVSVVQQGVIGEDRIWSFYPGLTVDPENNVAIGYYTTAADQYAALNVSVRTSSDAAGTMQARTVVKDGTGAVVKLFRDGRNRFADYSWMALDPADSASWIHGQYGTSGNWQTWIAKIQIAGPP